MTKIYTKIGDFGWSLIGGRNGGFRKSHEIFDTLESLDDVNSHIGLLNHYLSEPLKENTKKHKEFLTENRKTLIKTRADSTKIKNILQPVKKIINGLDIFFKWLIKKVRSLIGGGAFILLLEKIVGVDLSLLQKTLYVGIVIVIGIPVFLGVVLIILKKLETYLNKKLTINKDSEDKIDREEKYLQEKIDIIKEHQKFLIHHFQPLNYL